MKNLKVKKKLFISLILLACLSVIIAGGGGWGMKVLKGHLDLFIQKTLPNTERVWEMNSNLQSEATYLLLALQEKDSQKTAEYLDGANEDLKRNQALLEEFTKASSVDKSMIDGLYSVIQEQEQYRNEFHTQARLNTAAGNDNAYTVFHTKLLPLFVQESNELRTVIAAQNDLTDVRIDKAVNMFYILLAVQTGLVIAGLAIAVIITNALTKAIIPPLNQIRDASKALSQGDFDAPLTYDSQDEFGETCTALRESQGTLKAVIADECAILETMANGNFDVHSSMPKAYVGGLKSVLSSIRKINADLSDAILQINDGAEQVAAGSDQVSTGAQALAQGSTEQASAVEELSATINEIAESAQNNAKSAEHAMALSRTAGNHVQESTDDIEEMVQAMGKISQSSQEIEKIIAAIENIAFQTNILALNAAVEAARAGSAGKGFAVVADEVRNLAAKSDESAKATKELISNSIVSVQDGEKIVKRVAQSLMETRDATNTAVDEIIHITKAIEKDAVAITQVKDGIEQISAVVQTNSATSEESAAASEELTSQASMIKKLVSRFNVRTDDTIAGTSAQYAGFTSKTPETNKDYSAFSKY